MISKEQITALVQENGFDLHGVVPIGKSTTFTALETWLEKGMNGTMQWMSREDTVEKREDPHAILPNAQSVIVLAFNYTPPEIPEELLNDPSRGIIARYALYDDYHDIVGDKLKRIGEGIERAHDGLMDWKAYVDTGPFLEREWAQRAGLGFIGKNSNLINYQVGSYLFLAEILVSIPLPTMKKEENGGCARCTNCITGCPTNAIVADKTVDARKCISYMTIEHKGEIPEWMRPLMKNRIYGCDICQEVCPWNQRKQDAVEKSDFLVRADLVAPKLESLLFFDDESFREKFTKSPIKRAKREGFMRNVSVALGNWKYADAMRLLEEIIEKDPSELVQEHARWGLRQQ